MTGHIKAQPTKAMKKLSVTYLLCLMLGTASFVNGQSVSKCFEADRKEMDDRQSIELTITGNKVSGSFSVEPLDGVSGSRESFGFSGTRTSGNILNVKFTDKTPEQLSALGTRFVWTLAASAGRELLRIKFYNGQRLNASIDYFDCYSMLANHAERVRFAKGASRTQIQNPIKAPAAQAFFLLNVRKGQYVGVVAFGCTVEIYFPNGDVYAFIESAGTERDTTVNLDALGTDLPVPLSGDVLIRLTKAGESSNPDRATFFVTNTKNELDKNINQAFESK
jgi:hypothetical protein